MNDQTFEKYKSSLWYLTGIIMAYDIPLASLIFLFNHQNDVNWIVFFLSLIVASFIGSIICALLAAILITYYKVGLNANGIYGSNFWGLCRFVPWTSTRSTAYINFGGLRFIRVFYGNGSTPLWIPLFLSKQSPFEAAVKNLAPEGNPLRAYFEKRDALKHSEGSKA